MTIDENNQIIVMLMQAMLGAISENFRMVAINTDHAEIKISFFLAKDKDVDREEIEDIISSFEVSMMDVDIDYTGLGFSVFIVPEDRRLPEISGFRVFQRKEGDQVSV